PVMGSESDERKELELEKDIDEVEREDPDLRLATITWGMKIKAASNTLRSDTAWRMLIGKGEPPKKAGGRARQKQTSMDVVKDDDDN
ncbi:hypothetical protein FRC00_006887, partial [Tulasnella sp. 408]